MLIIHKFYGLEPVAINVEEGTARCIVQFYYIGDSQRLAVRPKRSTAEFVPELFQVIVLNPAIIDHMILFRCGAAKLLRHGIKANEAHLNWRTGLELPDSAGL